MGNHPCQWSPEVLEVLKGKLMRFRKPLHVHDPFAGTGVRLGKLCDEIGATFSGADIEDWEGRDERVKVITSLYPSSYPYGEFVIVTSPVYQNKRLADYADGPLPTTKTKGRRDYGIALGRALHKGNLARLSGRTAKEAEYYLGHGEIVRLWGSHVLLNVDNPIGNKWIKLLHSHGYHIRGVHPCYTKRYRGLDNAEKRAEYEVVIDAWKSTP